MILTTNSSSWLRHCMVVSPSATLNLLWAVTESSIVYASVNTKPMTRQQGRENVFGQGMGRKYKI